MLGTFKVVIRQACALHVLHVLAYVLFERMHIRSLLRRQQSLSHIAVMMHVGALQQAAAQGQGAAWIERTA